MTFIMPYLNILVLLSIFLDLVDQLVPELAVGLARVRAGAFWPAILFAQLMPGFNVENRAVVGSRSCCLQLQGVNKVSNELPHG